VPQQQTLRATGTDDALADTDSRMPEKADEKGALQGQQLDGEKGREPARDGEPTEPTGVTACDPEEAKTLVFPTKKNRRRATAATGDQYPLGEANYRKNPLEIRMSRYQAAQNPAHLIQIPG